MPVCNTTNQLCQGRALGDGCTVSSECSSLSCVGGVCCNGGGVNCYPDNDNDSFGDMFATPTRACTCPPGTVSNNSDCLDSATDPNAPFVNPNGAFHIFSDVPSMYTPDIRDTTPDGWDWNCSNAREMTLTGTIPNVSIGCTATGQGACAAGCTTETASVFQSIPCGGRLTGTICANMGCGNVNAPGCGNVTGIQMAPQGCK
jgi:hypothetical protein